VLKAGPSGHSVCCATVLGVEQAAAERKAPRCHGDDVNGRKVGFAVRARVDLRDAVVSGIEHHDVQWCRPFAACCISSSASLIASGTRLSMKTILARRLLRGRSCGCGLVAGAPRLHHAHFRAGRPETRAEQRSPLPPNRGCAAPAPRRGAATGRGTLLPRCGRACARRGGPAVKRALLAPAGAGFRWRACCRSSAPPAGQARREGLACAVLRTAGGSSRNRLAPHPRAAQIGFGNSSWTRNGVAGGVDDLVHQCHAPVTGCVSGQFRHDLGVLPGWIFRRKRRHHDCTRSGSTLATRMRGLSSTRSPGAGSAPPARRRSGCECALRELRGRQLVLAGQARGRCSRACASFCLGHFGLGPVWIERLLGVTSWRGDPRASEPLLGRS